MDPRQRLIDDVARRCGPSVAVLNLDGVPTSAPVVGNARARSTRRPVRAVTARRGGRPRRAGRSPIPFASSTR